MAGASYSQNTNVSSRQVAILAASSRLLDADTITEKQPSGRRVLNNPNLFRLEKDLESAYEPWMFAEMLITMKCSPYGNESTPEHQRTCERLVKAAKLEAFQTRTPIYDCLKRLASDEYARQGSERSGYWLPSKVELAKAAAKIVRATGEFPPELVALLGHVEAIARVSGIELVQPQFPASATADLTGRALVSQMTSTFMDLWVLDFDRGVFEPFAGGGRHLSHASWSADGSMIAGTGRIFGNRRNAILVLNGDGSERNRVSTRTSNGAEDNPCWLPDGRRLLFRTGEGTTCCAHHDGEQWRTLYALETAHHCVSIKGRIARTVYRNDHYHVEIGGKDGNEPYESVPGTTDVRGAISWSRTGRYLAFGNLIEPGRGAVCILEFGSRERNTTFLTSHNGEPRSVCFSPDERHVLYTWRDSRGRWSVRAVNVETREICIVVRDLSEPIIGCHAWRR